MTPDFAKAVDPVFERLLSILDQVEAGAELDVEKQQERICQVLDRADAQIGGGEEWLLAKYALACWIDEILTRQPWSGRDWWIMHPLERELFASANAATDFFVKAREASQTRDRNALEVFYICAILGFRGVYENPKLQGLIPGYALPERLQDWLTQTAEAIRLKPGRPALPSRWGRIGPGAPPREGRSWMIAAWVLATVSMCAAGLVTFFAFLLGAD
jgi:type VI secretion system protein ImpK